MAHKSLEKIVTDLQSTVVSLVSKITSLEAKISEQSEILLKQSGVISKVIGGHDSDVEHTHANNKRAHSASTSNATNNINKRASINANQSTSNGKQNVTEREKRHIARYNTRQPTQQPQPVRPTAVAAAAAAVPPLPKPATTGGVTKNATVTPKDKVHSATTRSYAETIKTPPITIDEDKQISDDNKWKTVENKRKHYRNRPVMLGTGVKNDSLKMAEQMKYLFKCVVFCSRNI